MLHFYLAGINNQNFLMRDKETGTWWQQISGKALYGPLKGESLELILSDELTFGEWRSEAPEGKLLAPVPKYTKEYDSNWEPQVAKLPVVISFPGTELKSRDVVVGLTVGGASRAYPWDTLVKQSPVMDHAGGTPLLIAVGPDGKSFRVFVSEVDGKYAEFFLKGEAEAPTPGTPKVEVGTELNVATRSGTKIESASSPAATPGNSKPWVLLDTATASEWNFQGCAVSGPSTGKCLDRVPALKDYWFDWRNYHPDTSIYKH